jgi:hypothetical protein
MEPFRIITTPEELAALRIDSIICQPRVPSSALRKAWGGMTPNEDRSDLYVGFGSAKEWDIDQAWSILTMHWTAWASGSTPSARSPPAWTKPGSCGIPPPLPRCR